MSFFDDLQAELFETDMAFQASSSPMEEEDEEESPGLLEETWWLLKDENPKMSDIYEKAGHSLDKMIKERYKIHPVQIDGKPTLFLARYDLPQQGQKLQHPDGELFKGCIGMADFLSGFPWENQELLAFIGEWSSQKDKQREVQKADKSDPVPPIPRDFFEGYDERRLLMNVFYFDEKNVETWADDLKEEPKPEGLHWWVRLNFERKGKFPVPGEFTAMVARQWVTLPWGEQKSSPYMFSGNWLDTVYLTGAVVKSVDDSGDYPVYTVTWRKYECTVKPTDFAQYKPEDRVTILKKAGSNKQSQLWRDDDTEKFDEKEWVIAPLSFYGGL